MFRPANSPNARFGECFSIASKPPPRALSPIAPTMYAAVKPTALLRAFSREVYSASLQRLPVPKGREVRIIFSR